MAQARLLCLSIFASVSYRPPFLIMWSKMIVIFLEHHIMLDHHLQIICSFSFSVLLLLKLPNIRQLNTSFLFFPFPFFFSSLDYKSKISGSESTGGPVQVFLLLLYPLQALFRSKVPDVLSSNSSSVDRQILANLTSSFPKVEL